MTLHPQSVYRLTPGQANDQLLYFTSPSLTADDRTLVFISDRDSPVPKAHDPHALVNLYALDRATGDVRRLTDNQDGYLWSYVYFEGRPHRGIGLASPSLHAPSGDVYYIQGDDLRVVNAYSGQTRRLAPLPHDHVTGFTHVSDDNTRVCVPTIHQSAFTDIRAIDATVQRLGLVGHIRVFDTQTGKQVQDIEVERGWVTHVQFQPGRNNVILFNHEWPADCGIRRVWLWDGQRIRRIREEGENANGTRRRREDWVCHEVWSRDGYWILYHGAYTAQPGVQQTGSTSGAVGFLGRVAAEGGEPVEIPFPPHFTRYGHFTLGLDDRTLVSDGYAEFDQGGLALDGDPPLDTGRGQWISLLRADWERGVLDWTPVLRHGSSWDSQDAHPHPVFNHAGDEILFTSDISGRRAVYTVQLGDRARP
jgi:oligogalacturonide lyase